MYDLRESDEITQTVHERPLVAKHSFLRELLTEIFDRTDHRFFDAFILLEP